jgi:predicted nucleic acid-binding protein
MERRTVKIFLDSNVILSGLISDRGGPRLILDILSLGLPVLRGVTGRYNLTEIERSIVTKLPTVNPVLNDCLSKMNLELVFLPFSDEMEPFRGMVDDKDLPVITSASIARADYFVSGDERLLSRLRRAASFPGRPCRPDEFLNDLLIRVFTGEMPGEESHDRPKWRGGTDAADGKAR